MNFSWALKITNQRDIKKYGNPCRWKTIANEMKSHLKDSKVLLISISKPILPAKYFLLSKFIQSKNATVLSSIFPPIGSGQSAKSW